MCLSFDLTSISSKKLGYVANISNLKNSHERSSFLDLTYCADVGEVEPEPQIFRVFVQKA